MKHLVIAAGLVLCAAPGFADSWESVARMVCTDPATVARCREGLAYNQRVTEQALRYMNSPEGLAREADREAAAEAEHRPAVPHNDPGAVDMCAPPRSMGRDGCQLYRPLDSKE